MSQAADAQSGGNMGDDPRTTDSRMMRIMSGAAVLVGALLVVSPFVFEATETAMWNNVIVGVAIIILAGFNNYRLMSDRLGNVGVSTLVALLGLWTLIVPFLFAMGSTELIWGTAIAGLIVAILAGYNAYTTRRAGTAGTRTRA